MSNEIVELRNLEIGERFIYAIDRTNPKANRWKVLSKNLFNRQAGTATRDCYNETLKETFSKQSRKQVIKLPIK